MPERFSSLDVLCMSLFLVCLCCVGWSLVPNSGGLCQAPSHYDGSCPQVLDLRSTPPQVGRGCQLLRPGALLGCSVQWLAIRAVLQEKTQTCSDLSFPCVGECTQDFMQSCPSGWSLDGSGSCVAPASYDGQCVTTKDFSYLGPCFPRAFSVKRSVVHGLCCRGRHC